MGTSAGIGAVVNALTGGIGSALFGNKISPEAAQQALAARAAGYPIVTGNIPGASPAAKLAGKVFGMTKEDSAGATKRLMQSLGSNDSVLTGDTIIDAEKAIKSRLDSIPANAQDVTWQHVGSRLDPIKQEAQDKLWNDPAALAAVKAHIGRVEKQLDAGGITGPQLQTALASNGALSRDAAGPTAVNHYATNIKQVLQDSLADADPEARKALMLANSQYRNLSMIKSAGVDKLAGIDGIVDPNKLGNAILAKYNKSFANASIASTAAGNPVDIGQLGTVAKEFGPQPVTKLSLPTKVGIGAGIGTALGGEEAYMGLPLLHSLMNHPYLESLLGIGTGAGMLGIGALQNTGAMTNFLLSRASRGAGPILGGANPLIAPAVASQGRSALNVPSGNPTQPSTNWDNWLRGQSFLESPRGEASKESSAKGYFQFIDGTAKRAVSAGLPNPQEGSYSEQAAATRAYIEKFYPSAAQAITQGDYPTAVRSLAGEWPSLPGGSQQQDPSQYAQWNKILGAGGAAASQ